MEPEKLVKLLLKLDNLKDISRTGWQIAGLTCSRTESVAEHSWGVIHIASMICNQITESNPKVDLEKVLLMAIMHDYAESIISDIPKTATDLSKGFKEEKKDAEFVAIKSLIGHDSKLNSLWTELETCDTIESKIVHAADIFDMLIHAVRLENSGVSPGLLNHFFINSREKIEELDIPLITEIYNHIHTKHEYNRSIRDN